ncbi:intein [Couchioplanes caeruleus]|uniref:Intein n=1 Tax=Couchioplanes caeruleus TaxID=56438 RepID=A0A3N1GLY7_9ACTN|nr:intein [Couchioplanes caeruleus]
MDENHLDRMLAQDLADYDEDPEVRAAAKAALETNDPAKIKDFLDKGLPAYRKAADNRKKVEAAENRILVKKWAETGGPIVRERAAAVLATKNDTKIADFVKIGYAAAEAADAQEVINAAEQAKTIKARVEQIVAQGGYEVQNAGRHALESEDPAVIAEFYNNGYKVASQHDAEAQKQIKDALAARTKAVNDLTDLAQRATQAATAQKQIITASVAATGHLTVASNSMALVNKYAKQADGIYAADIPIRKAGGKTRTAELTKLRADACTELATTTRRADQVTAQANVAGTAAQTLVKTGLSHGVDWAQVIQAQADAATAAKQAAQTACHAAEATEAAAKTLDADRNATVQANNAVKYRQAAEREQAAAEKLAVQAEKLAAAAQAAEKDAREQRSRAEQKARDAWDHAEQAEQHYNGARQQRDEARRWTAIAVSEQLRARDAAIRAVAQQDAAKAKHAKAKPLYDEAVAARDRFTKKAEQARDILKRAQNSYRNANSKELEAQAAEARKLAMEVNCKNPDRPSGNGCPGPAEQAQIRHYAEQLRTDANVVRSAANQAQREAEGAASAVDAASVAAGQAAAAAAAAAAEARAAASQAAQAHQDAIAAATAANKAIEDAQRANALASAAVNKARAAMNRASAAKSDAQMTERSAQDSIRQAAIASFQSRVAGRAALDARTAAVGIADPAVTAIDAAAAYAETDNDAAMAAAIASNALTIGAEQSASAQKHAQDAAAAALHAAKQAEKAQAQVKPAHLAAHQAAEAAVRAVKASEVAIKAAHGAAKEAKAAIKAADDAAEADQRARWYSRAADRMAAEAGNDAATARQAYNSARAFGRTAQAAADNADKFADNAEAMGRSATNMVNAIHGIAKQIGAMPKNLGKAMWEAYNAEQQAKETEWLRWLKTQSDKAMSKLPVGGDIAKGAMDTLIGNANSLWTLGNCVAGPNAPAGDSFYVPDVTFLPNPERACEAIIQGALGFFSNPWSVLHLDEWKENWQRALGGTLIDTGSLLIPAAGAAGKFIKAGKIDGKLLKDDLTAASLLFGKESVATAIAKLGTVNVARLIDLKVNTKLKLDFSPDEVGDFLKAVEIHGIDAVEKNLRDLGDLPAAPRLKELAEGCLTGNSFSPETPVLLADGTRKAIADIRTGDQVRATDPVARLTAARTVTELHRNYDTALADVTVEDSSGRRSTIHTTQEHPFWNATTRQWTNAADLDGDAVHTTAGKRLRVTSVRSFAGGRTMYNLTVADLHTYYVIAGGHPVLVHNVGAAAAICGGTATDLRNSPGIAGGRVAAPARGADWLQGTHGNAGRIPGQIAAQLHGRTFKSFDDFRQQFWKAVGNDSELGAGFSAQNVARMKAGNSPFVATSQQYGGGRNYVLHHVQPIQHGGGVYDMDNIVVVTPLFHSQILSPNYHYGNG